MAAAKLLPMLEEEARKRQVANLKQGSAVPVPAGLPERQKDNGESAEQIGASMGVSARYVRMEQPERPPNRPRSGPALARGALEALGRP